MSVCVSASINNRRVRLSSTRTLADVFRIMHTHTHTHTHTKAQTDAHVRTRKPRQQRNSLSLSLSLSLILAVCSCLSRHDERLGLHGNTIQCVLGTARCCYIDAIQCLRSSLHSSLKTELSTCIIPFIVRFHLLDVGCYHALDSGFVRTNQRMDGWMDECQQQEQKVATARPDLDRVLGCQQTSPSERRPNANAHKQGFQNHQGRISSVPLMFSLFFFAVVIVVVYPRTGVSLYVSPSDHPTRSCSPMLCPSRHHQKRLEPS